MTAAKHFGIVHHFVMLEISHGNNEKNIFADLWWHILVKEEEWQQHCVFTIAYYVFH